MNPWKVFTVFAFIVCMLLGAIIYTDYDANYNLGGLKINKNTADTITKHYDNNGFVVCDNYAENCVSFIKIKE